MRHYHKKIIIEKLFPCPPSNNYNNLMIDDESVSYITTPMNSEIIAEIISSLLPHNISSSDMTIMDGTACVGGDTISFGKIFGTVIASEIETNRYKMLVNNLKEFELTNVVPVNDDCLKLYRRLNFVDIMYFDPPWGGTKYKNQCDIRLSIGDIYIDELVNIIFNKDSRDVNGTVRSNVKMVVLKLPKNYDLLTLYQITKHNDVSMLLYELNKMLIVVFKRNDFIDNTIKNYDRLSACL